MMTSKNPLTKEEKWLERDRNRMFNELERQKLQFINNIKNQTKEICEIAVSENKDSFKYIHDKNEHICNIALQIDCSLFKIIPKNNQTNELCKLVLQKDGLLLEFVDNTNIF